MAHPNEELGRREMDAAMRGDADAMLAFYTDDVVLHYPGRNALSGEHRGKQGLREWMNTIGELIGPDGSFTRSLHDVIANDDHVIQLVSVDARRSDGRIAHWNAAITMHVREGRFSEIWIAIDDPYAVDAFLA